MRCGPGVDAKTSFTSRQEGEERTPHSMDNGWEFEARPCQYRNLLGASALAISSLQLPLLLTHACLCTRTHCPMVWPIYLFERPLLMKGLES